MSEPGFSFPEAGENVLQNFKRELPIRRSYKEALTRSPYKALLISRHAPNTRMIRMIKP